MVASSTCHFTLLFESTPLQLSAKISHSIRSTRATAHNGRKVTLFNSILFSSPSPYKFLLYRHTVVEHDRARLSQRSPNYCCILNIYQEDSLCMEFFGSLCSDRLGGQPLQSNFPMERTKYSRIRSGYQEHPRVLFEASYPSRFFSVGRLLLL